MYIKTRVLLARSFISFTSSMPLFAMDLPKKKKKKKQVKLCRKKNTCTEGCGRQGQTQSSRCRRSMRGPAGEPVSVSFVTSDGVHVRLRENSLQTTTHPTWRHEARVSFAEGPLCQDHCLRSCPSSDWQEAPTNGRCTLELFGIARASFGRRQGGCSFLFCRFQIKKNVCKKRHTYQRVQSRGFQQQGHRFS